MPLYRLTWTITEHGYLAENGEKFLEAFVNHFPQVGPVVSQNTASGHLSVTFSVEASDWEDAVEQGKNIFAYGAAATDLEPSEFVDLSVSLAAAEAYEEERELQPA